MYIYVIIGSFLYLIFLLNIPLFHDINKGLTHVKLMRIILVIPIIIFLYFLTVFRSLNVGTDYSMYHHLYFNGKYVEVFDYFIILVYDLARDKGDFLFFTFILTALFLLFNLIAIKKISHSFYISFTFFILSFYFFYIYNGMRQAVAISIIFLGIYFIQKEKLKVKDFLLYVLLIFIAMQFHFSAIYMLPLFALRFLKATKFIVIGAFFITVIGYFSPFTKDIYTNFLMNFDFYVQKYENNPEKFFGVNKEKNLLEFIPVLIQYFILYYSLTLKQTKSISENFIIVYYLGFLLLYLGSGIEAIDRIQFYFYPSIILFYDYLIYTIYTTRSTRINHSSINVSNMMVLFSISFWFLYFVIRVLQGTHGIIPYEFMS